MRKASKINNITELRAEIARLNALKFEQEVYLKDQYTLLNRKIEAPIRFIRTFTSRIPGVNMFTQLFSAPKTKLGLEDDGQNGWLNKAMRVGVPFILNRLFLKKAGWLKKALVLVASETALGQVNKDKISELVGKAADFIRPKQKKSKKIKPIIEEEQDHFGIPPGSETY